MKTRPIVNLWFVLSILPFNARSTEIYTYDVNWPDIYLQGTFALGVDSAFGDYFSTQAVGTYEGVTRFPQQTWRSVEFSAQPDLAEITFIWAQGYTGYAVSPSYVGRPAPWTNGDEAWEDLLAKGAADGVFITVVPEPAAATLLCAGLPLLLFRSRTRFLQAIPIPNIVTAGGCN